MAGRIRSLKPEFLEDDRAADLSSDASRLFVGCILMADDYGNLRITIGHLAGAVFWRLIEDGRITLAQVEAARAELLAPGPWDARAGRCRPGLLQPYRVRGQVYAHIAGWEKHQRVDHPGAPRVPGPDDSEADGILIDSASVQKIRESLASDTRNPRETLAPDPDLRSPISDPEQRNVGFENPPPSGAGLSPVLKVDPEPLAGVPAPAAAFGDLAPVDQAPEPPVADAWQAVEPTIGPFNDPTGAQASPDPVNGQPEPPACPPAEEPASATVPATAPAGQVTVPFVPSDPGQAALPLALAPVLAQYDPVEAIFAEYTAEWRRVIRGRRAPTLDTKRRKLTFARLREFCEDDLKAAARGIFASEWHVENKQTGYDLAMRDAAHVERFMQCNEEARRKADAAARAKQGIPEWLSGAARPSSRVMSALRLRGAEPPENGAADIDLDAMIADLGSVEVA